MNYNKTALKFLEKSMDDKVSFGMLLRSIRIRDSLTQKELAEMLGVTVSHISNIENGRKFVSVEKAANFSRILKDSEKFFVWISLQDQIIMAGLPYKVTLTP